MGIDTQVDEASFTLDSDVMKRPREQPPREPERKHVVYFVDRSLAQIVRADHLIGIRGVGQLKRYQRAMVHLENAEVSLRLAVATLTLLEHLSQK